MISVMLPKVFVATRLPARSRGVRTSEPGMVMTWNDFSAVS